MHLVEHFHAAATTGHTQVHRHHPTAEEEEKAIYERGPAMLVKTERKVTDTVTTTTIAGWTETEAERHGYDLPEGTLGVCGLRGNARSKDTFLNNLEWIFKLSCNIITGTEPLGSKLDTQYVMLVKHVQQNNIFLN